ncbi:beta-glucosidase [Colletotrichum tamarilloi]|uniref:Probable beta-glucosidase G n=1 Tax=Colletotrichum tamarilloi TaxID=1209934 RepID=A0ABQ9QHF5_9PEZI|nr:beta-glucosidase [Colletotrichum tamarilloi]KAK1470419.1 beta-glucosidase [Colletotrichum tamarilloi]
MLWKSLLLLFGAQLSLTSQIHHRSSNNGTRDRSTALALANTLISRLTLEEKVSMITGNSSAGNCIGVIAPIPRLGFKGICMLDGPSAVNRADLVSVFPSGITAAATWDREMIYRRGVAIAEEFKGKGGHVILGPSTGPMGRAALGGRNWEGFGPDPYLAGITIEHTITGMQSTGVQTCSKHYIANEQETQRSNTTVNGTVIEAISSNVDDRTVHELYLWPFANAIKAGTTSIMCSYNRFNQTYACENSHLLKELLRDELGFQGYTVSDWFATHSTADSINNGLDLEMPGAVPGNYPGAATFFGDKVLEAVADGTVKESRIDEMVRNILTPYYLLGQDAESYPSPDPSLRFVTLFQEVGLQVAKDTGFIPDGFVFTHGRDVRGDHAKLIREMGSAGTVLLKNSNQTLPLSKPQIIGVFGNDAGEMTNGFLRPSEVPEDTNTGTMIIGGGESFDRTSFELDGNSTAVINNVADFCATTVVVTHSGGVNTMPWANHTKIGAILAAHYPGQESGNSIVDLLWGDVAPSGRLPYSVPRNEEDAGPAIVNLTQPVVDPLAWQADFSEGQMIDYRHYDALGIEPLYEFGFGLTYTTFAVVDNQVGVGFIVGNSFIAARPDAAIPVQPGGHPQLWEDLISVKASISNTGNKTAFAIPQLYVSFPSSAPEGTPKKVLRGFKKIQIEAGGSAEVEFQLMRRDVSLWNASDKVWVIPEGEFTFRVGFSSRDLPAEKAFSVLG